MNNKLVLIIILLLATWSASAQDIFRSVCQGNLNRLDSLLQHKLISIQDDRGRSLLHWAIGCKQKEVFQFLIEKGIDFNHEDNENKTPIHVAISYNNEEYFDLLSDLQPDNTWIEKYGVSLLEKAILNKNETLVRKLIDNGVNINGENNRGSAPLEISKRIKAGNIYKILLSSGADESKIRSFTLEEYTWARNHHI